MTRVEVAELRRAIVAAADTLAEAGVASPRVDAEQLAAHAAGTSRGRLSLVGALDEGFLDRYGRLVEARARRVPLQHLIGTAGFGPVDLQVGPGVFVPRPETEALLEWAAEQGAQLSAARPLIVDLCTGSGALAVALARHIPSARVIAVDNSADALAYARRNVVGTGVELRDGDVCDPALFGDLDGGVDMLVANPPYLPDDADLEPEVAVHDPVHALFGGPDGNNVIAAIAVLAARWLRPAGLLAVEHDDAASSAVVDLMVNAGSFEQVTGRTDLAGRPRFVTARRRAVA